MQPENPSQCPCASGLLFDKCCGPYLSGEKNAPTAEALMRSRYSAFATHQLDYLEKSLLPEKRKGYDNDATSTWSKSSEWTGLEVLATEGGLAEDTAGIVEFNANYRQGGKDFKHHETSRFMKKDNIWYYRDAAGAANVPSAPKAGRNDPCPCGSGQKFKKCCGK